MMIIPSHLDTLISRLITCGLVKNQDIYGQMFRCPSISDKYSTLLMEDSFRTRYLFHISFNSLSSETRIYPKYWKCQTYESSVVPDQMPQTSTSDQRPQCWPLISQILDTSAGKWTCPTLG